MPGIRTLTVDARSFLAAHRCLCQLTLLTVLWLVATNIGQFGSTDTELRLRMTHAWWTAEPEVSETLTAPLSRENVFVGTTGAGGKRHVFYDPGQSVLMLPGDWLAAKLHRWVRAANYKHFRIGVITWLVFLPLNTLVVLSCFWLLCQFGVVPPLAVLSTITWFIGTTVLPYAQVAFQNNQVLLCVIVGYASILAWARSGRYRLAAVSGAAAGAALLFRTSSIIHVLTIGLFLIACNGIQKRDRVTAFKSLACWSLGFIPLALAGRLFDLVRFGNFWATGQMIWFRQIHTDPIFAGLPQLPASFPFTNAPQVGILGVLFSPAKSIFLYDPLLLPCLILAVIVWKTYTPYIRWYVALQLLNLALHIVLTSRLDFWHGDWAWGARYHVTSVDLLLIPLLPSAICRAFGGPVLVAWGMRLCILVAVLVQGVAICMPPAAEIGVEVLQRDPSCTQDPLNTWDSELNFRLGNRVLDLYCLGVASQSARCPEPAVLARARSESRCAAAAQDLQHQTRLAFFPFDPDNGALATPLGAALWATALLSALALTGWRFYEPARRHWKWTGNTIGCPALEHPNS